MKKIKYITFSLIAFCAIFTVAYALQVVKVGYALTQLGQHEDTPGIDFPLHYNSTLYAQNLTKDVNDNLGLSITRKTIFGWELEVRNNYWMLNRDATYNYNTPKKAEYRATVVLNMVGDGEQGKPMRGNLELY